MSEPNNENPPDNDSIPIPTPPTDTSHVVPSQIGKVYSVKLFTQRSRNLKQSHRVLLSSQQLSAALPSSYFISVPFPAYDQGPIGSCTANALCTAFKLQMPQGSNFDPSRLFLYYVERAMSGLIGQDGAYLDDGYNTLKNTGICREVTWPYDISKRDIRPSTDSYTEAKYNRIASWGIVTPVDGLMSTGVKQVLVNNKVVVIGILVYQSFESNTVASTGTVPMPNTSMEGLLGGHAIALVGFDDTKQAFLAVNSWGTNWGTTQPSNTSSRGYCYIPYAYINNSSLCDECLFMDGVTVSSPPVPQPSPPPRPVPVPVPPRPVPPPPPRPAPVPQPPPRPRPGPRPRPRPRPRPQPRPRRPQPRPRRPQPPRPRRPQPLRPRPRPRRV